MRLLSFVRLHLKLLIGHCQSARDDASVDIFGWHSSVECSIPLHDCPSFRWYHRDCICVTYQSSNSTRRLHFYNQSVEICSCFTFIRHKITIHTCDNYNVYVLETSELNHFHSEMSMCHHRSAPLMERDGFTFLLMEISHRKHLIRMEIVANWNVFDCDSPLLRYSSATVMRLNWATLLCFSVIGSN